MHAWFSRKIFRLFTGVNEIDSTYIDIVCCQNNMSKYKVFKVPSRGSE